MSAQIEPATRKDGRRKGAQHQPRWIELTEQRGQQDVQSAQLGPIESKRADGRGHRKQGGINAAARDLGIERKEAQRAIAIASLSPQPDLIT